MKRKELTNFFNQGFGWVCKNCESKLKTNEAERSRLMTEGEAESKQPEFSNKAMAKWADSEQQILICPQCQITENNVEGL